MYNHIIQSYSILLADSCKKYIKTYNSFLGGGGGLIAKSCLTLATPWTVACQAPLSMGFSRQEYWSGLPFPSPNKDFKEINIIYYI